MIHKKGILICHVSSKPGEDVDRDIFGGMFTAVQDFVKDSFNGKVDTGLKKMAFGEQMVHIEHGPYYFITAIVSEGEPVFLNLHMLEILREVEEEYGSVLKDWDGDMSKVKGIDNILKKLFQATDDNVPVGKTFTEVLLGGTVVDNGELYVPMPEKVENEEEKKKLIFKRVRKK